MDQNHSIFGARLRQPRRPRLDGVAEGWQARTALYLDGCNAADLVGFVTVASDFYPKLRAHFEEEAGDRLAGSGW